MGPKNSNRVNRLKEAENYELEQMKNHLKDYLGIKDQKFEDWERDDPNRVVLRQKAEW
jgi:hypothetical protein